MGTFQKMWIFFFLVSLLATIAGDNQAAQTEELNLPKDTTMRLSVRELLISGNTLVSTSDMLDYMPAVFNASEQPLTRADSQFLYDLRDIREIVANPGQPRQVSLRTIQGLTQYIFSVYRKKDYAGVFIYVPEGAIKDGTKLIDGILPINILEAPVTEIRVKFFDAERNEVDVEEGHPLRLAIEEFSPIERGKVASQKTLDNYVNLLNLRSDRHVSAVVSLGAKPNTLAVEYDVYVSEPSKLRKNKITPQSMEPINIARIIYDAYPHSDLLPINAVQDCRSLQSLQTKVTGENIGDGLFSFMVQEIFDDSGGTLDGAIWVLERTKSNVEAVLRALREADANQQ